MVGKTQVSNGDEDIKEFITKVELNSALKDDDVDKCAQNMASTLEGSASDVYLRLNHDDRKNVNKMKEKLLKEFERGRIDREEAIRILWN